MVETIGQKEEANVEQKDNANPSEPAKAEEPKESKIAEIWIKDGRIILDACPEFWQNKLMAVGILEYCKDVVKDMKYEEQKPRISVAQNLNGLRSFLRKKKR